jgi:hypothetical protein
MIYAQLSPYFYSAMNSFWYDACEKNKHAPELLIFAMGQEPFARYVTYEE